MLPGVDSALEGGPPKGPTLEIELFSAHARIAGSGNLGAYTRLPDLQSSHEDTPPLQHSLALSPSGAPPAHTAPTLAAPADAAV